MTRKIISFCMGTLFFCCACKKINAQSPDWQANLEQIIPVSPTAASLIKFGNTPVNYFTGSASVGIPLFQVGRKELSVSIGLNYQHNGLKVEEIPSWVGLGWSLESGGVISRSIQGIADEGVNGYMSLALGSGMTVKFIKDSMLSPTYEEDIKTNLRQAGKGLFDLEPDVFMFNFSGGSGKFYYNQETNKFFSVPAQKIEITRYDNGFLIIGENGNRYYFNDQEFTTAQSPTCNNSQAQAASSRNVSSWYLSKVVNKTQTDSVVYSYTDTYYNFDNLSTSTKYRLLSQLTGDGEVIPISFSDQVCWQNTIIEGKRLSLINFSDGYLKFSTFSHQRCDLYGEKALQKVELFNKADELQKRFLLNYGYFGTNTNPTNCSVTNYEWRLKLKEVLEQTKDSLTVGAYRMDYDESNSFPSRMSYAQDHWGYYNGATSNSSLIPSLMWSNFSGGVFYENGDDRKPNFAYAKIGSLNSITYPTGGSTSFEYENNEVKDSLVQPEFTLQTVHLEGDHNGGIQTTYVDTFEVNAPVSFYNFYNTNGGGYARVNFVDIGCDLSGGASSCAVLTVNGVSPGAPSFGPFTVSGNDIYLPNGTYEIKAVFSQVPAGYADFYYSLQWREAVLSNSNLVGGVRIKKITDTDSLDATKRNIRKFYYSSAIDSLSSGEICGYPNGYTTDFYFRQHTGGCGGYFSSFKKFSSISNYPLIAHQGGYVAYKEVTVDYGENAENGRSKYYFNYVPDMVSRLPSAAIAYDWKRGLLEKEEVYKNTGAGFSLQKTDTSIYIDLASVDTTLARPAYGLKPWFNVTVNSGGTLCGIGDQANAEVPFLHEYEISSGLVKPQSAYSTFFENGNQLSTNTLTSYSKNSYLPNKIVTLDSKGDTLTIQIVYNSDYTLVGSSPSWLYELKQKNITGFPVEKLLFRKAPGGNSFVTNAMLTTTKATKPFADKVFLLNTSSPIAGGSFSISHVDGSGNFNMDAAYEERASFLKYDNKDNLVSQQKANDVIQSYIWDYGKLYPIAEVANADSASIAYTSFESDGKGGWSYSGSVSNDATSPTGGKCYLTTGGNITRSALASGTYIVSYWGKSGSVNINSAGPTKTGKTIGNWTYYEHEVTGTSITVSGSNYVDELRLYPKGAQMKTFTYKPLTGMTSQCDVTNRIIYYEYDSFNRLKLIRDEDHNIIKQMDYQYQAANNQ